MSITTMPSGRAVRRVGPVALAFGAGAIATAVLLGGRGPALAQDAGGDAPPMPPEMLEAIAAYETLQQPGEAHERLGRMVGTWETEMTWWMEPGGPATTSRGSAEYSWLFDGRWLAQRYRGEIMGRPYEGFGLSGFDNLRRQAIDAWVDSESTGMTVSRGDWTADGTHLVLTGEMDDPMNDRLATAFRSVVTFHDDDHFTYEMQELLADAEPSTVMRIEYRRRDG